MCFISIPHARHEESNYNGNTKRVWGVGEEKESETCSNGGTK